MKHPVFNYETQEWEDNRELFLSQLKEELALLESDKGVEYAAYTRNRHECPISGESPEAYRWCCLNNVRAMIASA